MIRDDLASALATALDALGVETTGTVHLERPSRREHGDWSSNVALASAKRAGRNPRELGQEIVVGREVGLVAEEVVHHDDVAARYLTVVSTYAKHKQEVIV